MFYTHSQYNQSPSRLGNCRESRGLVKVFSRGINSIPPLSFLKLFLLYFLFVSHCIIVYFGSKVSIYGLVSPSLPPLWLGTNRSPVGTGSVLIFDSGSVFVWRKPDFTSNLEKQMLTSRGELV